MSTYVVGDIQGCFTSLKHLLDHCKFDPPKDTLWVLGDMINRGPSNLQTLRFLATLPKARFVLGNHDLHFLAVANTNRNPSKSDTLGDILGSDELSEMVDWLRQQPLAFYDSTFDVFLSHAGIPHTWSIDKALALAGEVHTTLVGDDYIAFLEQMYGNEPNLFDESLTGHERLRCITNYLTRLRFCSEDARLELKTKTEIAPPGYQPWFTFPRQDSTRILFGHWAAIEGKTHSTQFVALDTGCVWGRSLTALRLDDNKLFSVPAQSAP